MELTVLITALHREVEKRRAVDEAAAKLAQALGLMPRARSQRRPRLATSRDCRRWRSRFAI